MNLHTEHDFFNHKNSGNEISGKEIITLQNVSVSYRVPQEQIRTFKEFAIKRVKGKVKFQILLALNEINLEVKKGEVFGLIGANGAGKTTLLRLVARVMKPTKGRVVVLGRVAPLLAMGAGFHPELTGRENIYLNGALLGLNRHQIDERFDEIVEFSELGGFIDAPLRTYSSGMNSRLGFAVATTEMPDILILDEVLSVGDISFQEKSKERIERFQREGATTLLVSHSMNMVEKLCDRIAWLDHGKIIRVGEATEIVNAFKDFMKVE
ncbi:MAG: ABC transporter ATP-binding protein [Anaerolineaceae bacterium]|jgi:ABC-2 type transport system ATP-binding protein/lipopolysaccharide transport system ATP-binding protein|nr:ABC transporter ATP-binding protein [Anaerolineaceae bacterium]